MRMEAVKRTELATSTMALRAMSCNVSRTGTFIMTFGVADASKQRLWGCGHSHDGIIRIALKPVTLKTWGLRHTHRYNLTVTCKTGTPVKISHGRVAVTRKCMPTSHEEADNIFVNNW